MTLIKRDVEVLQVQSGQTRAVAEEARATSERTESTLLDIRQSLIDRQSQEHNEYVDVFRAMGSDASRDTLLKGLRTAAHEGLITSEGVRSPVWETDLHYRYVIDRPEAELEVRLEADDGTVISAHLWDDKTPADEFYQLLVYAVRDAGQDLGLGLNDPTQSVTDLAEMLAEVAGLHSQVLMGHRDTLNNIIERVDGWYFTERFVLPRENLKYNIGVDQLNEMDWEEHLRGKGWYDAPVALAFARRLYGIPPHGS